MNSTAIEGVLTQPEKWRPPHDKLEYKSSHVSIDFSLSPE